MLKKLIQTTPVSSVARIHTYLSISQLQSTQRVLTDMCERLSQLVTSGRIRIQSLLEQCMTLLDSLRVAMVTAHPIAGIDLRHLNSKLDTLISLLHQTERQRVICDSTRHLCISMFCLLNVRGCVNRMKTQKRPWNCFTRSEVNVVSCMNMRTVT